MATGYVVAVVGATGAAGSTTLRILEGRKFPVRELRAFASERSQGKTVRFNGEIVRVEKVTAEAFRGVEIAFFSAGSAQSREFAPLAVRSGAIVVDKSSAFRMDPGVPLVVPEINPHAVKGHKGIVASPNCTTVVTVMPLKPLHDAARIRRVIAVSYQAVSGAGVNGVEELRRQALAWAKGEPIEARHFPHQIAFNLIPHIDRFGAGGYTGEEWKLVNEVRKILDETQRTEEKPKVQITFQEGEAVKIKEGPFENFDGVIESVNPEKGLVKVMVSIFGRGTPVELEYWQVETL